MKKLTVKEELFVREYLIDLDPARAAKAAGYGQSTQKTKAYCWVSRSEVKPHVFFAIEKLRHERLMKLEHDGDWVLAELFRLYYALSYNNLIKYDKDHKFIGVDLDGATPDALDAIEAMQVDTTQLAPVKDVKGSVVARAYVDKVKIKMHNKLEVLALIAKHTKISAFVDRHEHSGPDGGPIPLPEMTDLELARRVGHLMERGLKG